MINISKLRKDILSGKKSIDSLERYQHDIVSLYHLLMSKKVLTKEEFDNTKELILLCMDYYTYASSGESLITDRMYDLLMNHYINNGGKVISTSDIIETQTQWRFIKHEFPGIVGTIKKAYTEDELYTYLQKWKSASDYMKFIIAPKYDGISSGIKINSDGEILLGVTRNNGIKGQDITKVIKAAHNARDIGGYYATKLKKGETAWVKTELCVSSKNYEELIQEKRYKNRRSATSGIVNSPKNLSLANYITIIPLAEYHMNSDMISYHPPDAEIVRVRDVYELMKHIEKMLSMIRDSSYDFRTDGVVIYPMGDHVLPNFEDLMDNAIAYKVNTEEALTRVKYGYVSVGRLGYAVPMLHVYPAEVNETTVTDASLGSFDKFVSMDLHEGEQVLVYSAGDVIPQAKLPEHRKYKKSSDLLQIKKRCPYCGEKLTRYKATYKCTNEECQRVTSGRISNFITKLEVENVSDRTIEDLMEFGLLRVIPDLFELEEAEIASLKGYGKKSAHIICSEMEKLKAKEIPVSSLLGALGIPSISNKKCKNLMKIMPIDQMLTIKPKKLYYELLAADNVADKTATIFIDFLEENKDLILNLMNIMNIVDDIEYKGNVVFTGFRNPDLKKKFEEIGYEVSSNVNDETLAVIDISNDHTSTKCKAAKSKGVAIVHLSEVDDVLKELKKRR